MWNEYGACGGIRTTEDQVHKDSRLESLDSGGTQQRAGVYSSKKVEDEQYVYSSLGMQQRAGVHSSKKVEDKQ